MGDINVGKIDRKIGVGAGEILGAEIPRSALRTGLVNLGNVS